MDRHVHSVILKVNGQEKIGEADISNGTQVARIVVDQALDAPDYFQAELQLYNAAKANEVQLLDECKLGDEIEIQVGFDDLATVFKGEVSYIEPRFGEEDNVVALSGYDFMHRLTRGTSSRTFSDGVEKVKLGDLAKEVIQKAEAREGETSDGLSPDASSGEIERLYEAQWEISDWEFIQSIGFALVADSRNETDMKKVSVKELETSGEPVVTVCRDKADPNDAKIAMSAEFSMSSVRQVAKVEVRGWNEKEKKAFTGVHKAVDAPGPIEGKEGPKLANKAHYGSESSGRVLTIIDHPVKDKAEADKVAKAIFNDIAMQFITGELTILGSPTYVPGKMVEVKQFGKAYDGKYMITKATHIYDGSASDTDPYTTRLSIARNSAPE